jgi:hypothetical protein
VLSLSATEVAHGIHYAIVGVGVVGLVALLAPGFLAHPSTPRDEHDARVRALRTAIDTDALTTSFQLARTTVAKRQAPVLTTTQRMLLPLAVVSSAAAAGVHAAAGPAHFREATLFGLFFAGSALLQLVWAGAVAVRASRPLLVAGVVGNLAVVALWAVTRTVGLPFGLLPEPEALGPWDLACAGWELAVAGCCVAALRSLLRDTPPSPVRLVEWRHWHPGVRLFAGASVAMLVVLSLSGAGS